MYIMYVDESGDVGLHNSPTRYFVLSGLVLHELRWKDCLEQLIDFRQRMRKTFGLKLREELHASAMINAPGVLARIPRNNRLTIIRHFTNELVHLADLNAINVVVDKRGKPTNYDVFTSAWRALLQRFENTIAHRNFAGLANPDERGIIFADHTDDRKLVMLMRQMRRYNPIPNQPQYGIGYRNLAVTRLVEDPSFRDSAHSYFVQAADLVAFLLYQKLCPNSYIRRKSGQNYFDRLNPILCTVASSSDPQGIVRL